MTAPSTDRAKALEQANDQAQPCEPQPCKPQPLKPERGPRLLFFSGGSALGPAASALIHHSHHSMHLITPFDSGGSSRELRFAFDMPALGDLRNRLMALADQSISANRAVYRLFSHRLYSAKEPMAITARLELMAAGKDPLVMAIAQPLRSAIVRHLHHFVREMPAQLSLEGACIGNLVLAAGYLLGDKTIEPVLELYSKFILARGLVRPIVSGNYHLFARYDTGETVLGQHRVTRERLGDARITGIGLSRSEERLEPVETEISVDIAAIIAKAELICYPIGSFYTSLCATLLPASIGAAVAANPCPKVYIPNTTSDVENHGQTIEQEVDYLIEMLRSPAVDGGAALPPQDLLGTVLLDEDLSYYPRGVNVAAIEDRGFKVVRTPLITDARSGMLDPERLVATLLGMIEPHDT